MKAWVLHDIGTITYEETGLPSTGDNEVLVKVKAVGICGSDIPRIFKDGAHRMPLIPGHEFSGEVVQIGKCAGEKWLHKRVGVFPLIPCRECIACRKEQYEMCRNYSYIGSRQDGAFAEYVAVPASNLIELPDNVSFEAAAMLEPMSVAVHAMRRANVAQTDTVVVYGLGTIGLLLVMFLLEKGIQNVLVVGNKASQREAVLRIGLPEQNFYDCTTGKAVVNFSNSIIGDSAEKICGSTMEKTAENMTDWLNAHTDGAGADVVFECVGKTDVFSKSIELAAPGGTVCTVGNPHGDMTLEKSVYWKILRNQLTVAGTWNSSFTGAEGDDWHYVLHRLEERRLQPENLITHKFSLENLEQGLWIMRDKTEEYIKVMVADKNII